MPVTIRLQRHGSKKRPFYRITVADSRARRDGRFIEHIGTYNPIVDPAEVKINKEKAHQWLDQGAQLSDTVRTLFAKAGVTTQTGRPIRAAETSADAE